MTKAAAILGLVCLALAMLLLGSVAAAFYGNLAAGGLVAFGASAFFVTHGLALAWLGRLLLPTLHGRPAGSARPARWLRLFFVLLVPANVLAMSAACGFPGCNVPCRLLTMTGLVMTAFAAAEALGATRLPLLLASIPIYAVPHCICGNPINTDWIELVGASPHCHAFSLLGMTFAALGLRGVAPRLCLLLAAAPAGAALAFAVGHHLFSFPW